MHNDLNRNDQNHQNHHSSALHDVRPLRPAYDVVVVGARAAGASTAMLLARRGLSVLAIDRSAYGSDTLSTHSLAGAGVLQLSRWGLLDTIRDAGTPTTRHVEFHYGDDRVAIDIPSRGDVDGLYSPRRTLLDATLSDAAVAAGADVRHGVTLVGLLRDATGRVNGVEIDVAGARLPICARLVVGADGVRSRVARDVRAETVRQESVAGAVVFGYFEGAAPDTILNFYDTDRVVGVIPTNDDLSVIWSAMPPDRFEADVRGRTAAAHREAVATVPQVADIVAGRDPVGGIKAFPGVPGFLRRAWGPGWALVGDAGYFKDPVSAHGITDAFIGAELVADAAAATLDGSTDEADAMGEYEAVRDAMAASMMPPVAQVISFPGDMSVVKAAFKEMSIAMRDEVGVIETRFGVPAAV